MSLTLYDFVGSPRGWKALIVAQYNGVKLNMADVKMGETNKTAEFLAQFPLGKVPALSTPAGPLTESNAIARFLARSSRVGNLYGLGAVEAGVVDQWVDWSSTELSPAADRMLAMSLGWTKYDKNGFNQAKKTIMGLLKILNGHLLNNQFLASNHVTLADICVATLLVYPFAYMIDAGMRKACPNVTRWLEFLVHQPEFVAVIGQPVEFCAKAAKPTDNVQLFVPSGPSAAAVSVGETKQTANNDGDEDDGFELSDSDSDEDIDLDEIARKKKEEREKAEAEKLAKARSNIIFDIKPYGSETDLSELEQQVRAITMKGLQWGESRLEDIAFGVQKIVILCQVYDQLVSVDELQEKIEDFEDCQSVDIASFNKV